MPMWKPLLAICVGASLGALVRWWLGAHMNAVLPTLPLGTLAANLIGGYLVGLAIAFFAFQPSVPVEWRLFVITGFCGGLTTFSTFSAEVVTLIQQRQIAWACGTAAVHLFGSVGMTLLGIATFAWIKR